MDVEKLISLVFDNKCLWDMQEKNYHNRDLSRQKWDIIAEEMSKVVSIIFVIFFIVLVGTHFFLFLT